MAHQRWNFAKDMNHDGQFTISDIWPMVEYVLFLPGDGVIYALLGTGVGNFLEISAKSYGGWWSGIFSGLVWAAAVVAWGVFSEWTELDIYFVETPLQIDDLEGYARLHHRAPMPIAAGEWQTTRFEFAELMDHGMIDVAQPDVGRVGGLTEARRVCDMAAERNRRIVPHCWKTGIGIAAAAHLAAVTAHCPFIEFLPSELCDSALRKELVDDELRLEGGIISLPKKPGLGIDINQDALKHYRVG